MSIKVYQEHGTNLANLNANLKKYASIIKLGVQGPPGLTFQLNNWDNNSPSFKIGYTGIFTFDFGDLVLENGQSVRCIQFNDDDKSQSLVNNSNMEIIVDILGVKENN